MHTSHSSKRSKAIAIGKERVLTRWGHTPAIRVTKEALTIAGVDESQPYQLEAEKGRIIIIFKSKAKLSATKPVSNRRKLLSKILSSIESLGSSEINRTTGRRGQELI
jgi:hypothetical protein